MSRGTLPPDLPALMRKRKAEEDAWKPKFLSKKERARLEEERLAKGAEESKPRQQQPTAPAVNGRSAQNGRTNGVNGYSKDTRRRPQHSIPTGPRAMQSQSQPQQQQQQPNGGKSSAKNEDAEQRKTKMEMNDAAERRARYMGPPVNQSTFSAKKKRRNNTANKFNFDWDANDDTSRPDDPIYAEQPLVPYKLGGFEMLTDEQIQAKANLLRQSENGQERARQYLDQMKKAKEHSARRTLGEHWSEKALGEMKQRDWRILKENYGIATKGGAIPNPLRDWEESDLPRTLLDIVAQVGYKDPTPIQRAAIPIALQSRDLIGVAVTGSGKTAAFLLPLLVYISKLPALNEQTKNDGPYALILAPTRELVQQIETEAKKFATPLGFTVVSIVGGHSLEEQAFALRNGAEIIVATPGRLVDCLERRLLVFSQCCYMIMDEADRMIDQGFEEPLTKILDALPLSNEKPDNEDAENPLLMGQYLGGRRYRQTMMYTATMPPPIAKIAGKYLRRPATVTIGNAGEAVETVEQRVEFVSGEDKRKKRLQDILNTHQFKPPIIVFVNTKGNCEMVARDIRSMGFSAVTLHSSKTQEQREAALNQVRHGQTEVLVATDLAGRGIDVPDISLVVNFTMSKSIESYTHRIGRTGRAGKMGVSITFLGDEDAGVLYDLKQIISKSSISKVPEELRRHEAAQSRPTRGGGGTGFGGGKASQWN